MAAVPPGAEPDEVGEEARRTLGHGMSFAAASFATSVAISMASSVATSRIYGVTVIGEYALVSAPWIIVSQVSSVNEQVAFLRSLALLPARDRRVSALFGAVVLFSFALTLSVAAVALIVAVLLLHGPVGQPQLVAPALVVLASYVVIDNTSWNLDMVFAAFRRGGDLFAARAAQVVAFLVVAVGMAAYTRSVWGLAVATVASFAAAFAVRIALVGRVMRRHTTRREIREAGPELRRMLGFGVRLLPGTLANGLTSQVGTWVLGSLAPLRDVGVYARAGGLSSRLSDAGYRVCEILFPTLVRAREEGDVERYRTALFDSLRLTAVALFGSVAVASGVARSVMAVFGPGFSQGANALTLLMFAYATSVVASIQAQPLLAEERPWAATATALVRLLVTVATVYPFARAWQATGVAASFLLGAVFELAGREVLLRRSALLRRGSMPTAGIAIKVMVVAVGGFAAADAVHATDGALVRTGVALIVGLIAAAALALVTGGIRRDERQRLAGMAGRLRRAT